MTWTSWLPVIFCFSPELHCSNTNTTITLCMNSRRLWLCRQWVVNSSGQSFICAFCFSFLISYSWMDPPQLVLSSVVYSFFTLAKKIAHFNTTSYKHMDPHKLVISAIVYAFFTLRKRHKRQSGGWVLGVHMFVRNSHQKLKRKAQIKDWLWKVISF